MKLSKHTCLIYQTHNITIQLQVVLQKSPNGNKIIIIIIIIIITRTASHTTKYIHQRDSPPVRLLGGECIIPKSTQYVTVVTDITQ